MCNHQSRHVNLATIQSIEGKTIREEQCTICNTVVKVVYVNGIEQLVTEKDVTKVEKPVVLEVQPEASTEEHDVIESDQVPDWAE